MTQTILLTFVAGVLAGNATPHFVKGITKEEFPTLFGPSPLVNLVAGWFMYVLAAILTVMADVAAHPIAALAAGAIGVLGMGVFHAHVGAAGLGRQPRAARGRTT
ncbi:hypothetical protein [Nonomuraea rubra]|uniref:Uncharacterized protein n=1 Tax=Nonomuraea rubra TaxID=46180 RepID=A0A7X0U3H2_9ACTN|nr:hypothetical protein [Nonomuraea rubra]MBB6553907.1 hypothetical protein [Nonomuraea rubra]